MDPSAATPEGTWLPCPSEASGAGRSASSRVRASNHTSPEVESSTTVTGVAVRTAESRAMRKSASIRPCASSMSGAVNRSVSAGSP